VSGLSRRWEGEHRPGHFDGVATVVAALVSLVQPTVTYVGRKDFQQAVVIQRLVRDLQLPGAVRVMPTVRESDGLAMSSRNAYLSAEERRQAVAMPRALAAAKRLARLGERRAGRIREAALSVLRRAGAKVDYVALAHPATLKPVDRLHGRAVILLAARFGTTRLIDNALVTVR
jgi:pantoate--beta-alanine ligase